MSVSSNAEQGGVTVCFGQRFAQSEQFNEIFREGMGLVETTAEYLDGQGRRDSKDLKPPVSIAYATESMRLTTRLLDLASWLLIQRSLREGEITADEAMTKREGMALRPFGRVSHIKHYDDLPKGLRDLIRTSYALSERISQIDKSLNSTEAGRQQPGANPVNEQLRQLETAFAAVS